MLQEIRGMRSRAGRVEPDRCGEDAGVSKRVFRRWRDRLRYKGSEGFIDRRIGKSSILKRRSGSCDLSREVPSFYNRIE